MLLCHAKPTSKSGPEIWNFTKLSIQNHSITFLPLFRHWASVLMFSFALKLLYPWDSVPPTFYSRPKMSIHVGLSWMTWCLRACVFEHHIWRKHSFWGRIWTAPRHTCPSQCISMCIFLPRWAQKIAIVSVWYVFCDLYLCIWLFIVATHDI